MRCREVKQTSSGADVLSGCPQSGENRHVVSLRSLCSVYLILLRPCSGSVQRLMWKDDSPCFGEAPQNTRAFIPWSIGTYRLQNHSKPLFFQNKALLTMRTKEPRQILSVVLLKGRQLFLDTSPPGLPGERKAKRRQQKEQQGAACPARRAGAELCRPRTCCPGREPCLQPTSGPPRKLRLLASHLICLAENSTVFAKTYSQGLDSTMLHQQLVIKLTRG